MLHVKVEDASVACWRVSPFSQILEKGREKHSADDHTHDGQTSSRSALRVVLGLDRVRRHGDSRAHSMKYRPIRFGGGPEAERAAV